MSGSPSNDEPKEKSVRKVSSGKRYTRKPPLETDLCAAAHAKSVATILSSPDTPTKRGSVAPTTSGCVVPLRDKVRNTCLIAQSELTAVALGAASVASGLDGSHGFAFAGTANAVQAPGSPTPMMDLSIPPSKRRRVSCKSPQSVD